jgi:hypothetical protein
MENKTRAERRKIFPSKFKEFSKIFSINSTLGELRPVVTEVTTQFLQPPISYGIFFDSSKAVTR